MSPIVEREAKNFLSSLVHIQSLGKSRDEIQRQLYKLNRPQDRLDFLSYLNNIITKQIEEHRPKCHTPGNCGYEKSRSVAIFNIEQEIEELAINHNPISGEGEEFSGREQVDIMIKIKEIIQELENQGLKQEIILDDLESLKEHFKLGKKQWSDLLIGKILRLTAEKVIENTVGKTILDTIFDSFNSGQFRLPSTN